MNNKFWFILVLLILIETFAMALIENSVKIKSYHYCISIVLYGIVCYLFYKLLTHSDKSGATVNAIWNCSTTIALTIISVFYFQKKLNMNEKVGIFFAILSILFMESVIKI